MPAIEEKRKVLDMSESPYFRYAILKLTEEGKYTYLNPVTKQIKIFDPADIWEKMLDFADLVKKDAKKNRE